MEQPVRERVHFEVRHAVGGKAGAGQHVVPLQHLVQHDPVEEAAQPEAEQDAGGDRKLPSLGPRIAHGAAAAYSPCFGSKRMAAPFMQ